MGKKKPISVHLTDEERQAFEKAMRADHMVDLGPWIAMVVRKYIAGADEQAKQLGLIEQVVKNIQRRIYSPNEIREIAGGSMDPVRD